MKTYMTFYAESETVQRVKDTAKAIDVPIGDLLDLIMRYGLSKLDQPQLKIWARTRPHRFGKLGVRAQAVLSALEVGSGPVHDIAKRAGIQPVHCRNTLVSLCHRGAVVSDKGIYSLR